MIPTGAPPLPDDLEALLRGLRLPHVRRAAPEVLATAKSQRWEPAEVLRTLLLEERRGRDRSAIASRRAAACFPPRRITITTALRNGDAAARRPSIRGRRMHRPSNR